MCATVNYQLLRARDVIPSKCMMKIIYESAVKAEFISSIDGKCSHCKRILNEQVFMTSNVKISNMYSTYSFVAQLRRDCQSER